MVRKLARPIFKHNPLESYRPMAFMSQVQFYRFFPFFPHFSKISRKPFWWPAPTCSASSPAPPASAAAHSSPPLHGSTHPWRRWCCCTPPTALPCQCSTRPRPSSSPAQSPAAACCWCPPRWVPLWSVQRLPWRLWPGQLLPSSCPSWIAFAFAAVVVELGRHQRVCLELGEI